MMAPVLRGTKLRAAAEARRVTAVTFSWISFSNASGSEPMKSLAPATPALLTRVVMAVSPARRASSFTRSALFVRSALMTSTLTPVSARRRSAKALRRASSRATRIRSWPRLARRSA